MGKKLVTVLLTALTVMLLTGCNNQKEAVTESAEGFLTALVNNDKKAAAQYATEEFMESETMKLMDPEYLADMFYASIGVDKEDLDEETQQIILDYETNVAKKAYKSFEIQDIKIQGDTASVTCGITLGYDPEASSVVSEEVEKLLGEYQTEHYDELVSVYKEDGDKGVQKKLYNDLIPIVIGKMQETLENSAPSEEKTILTLENRDKVWLVTDLVENRPGSAIASTAKESAAAVETSEEAVTSSSSEYAAESDTSGEFATEEPDAEESSEAGTTKEETRE